MLLRLLKKKPVLDDTTDVGEKAGRLFDSGMNCTQAVFQATTGLEDPTIMKIAEGFGGGIGDTGCLCGAISGGVMALGHAGRSKKSARLIEEFKQRNATACCRGLSREYKWLSREHLANCRRLTVETAEMVDRLLKD